jgi:hypothetical protein
MWHICTYLYLPSKSLTQDSVVYLQRKPYHLLQWSGQHTDTIKRWVSINVWRSILTNTVGHLLDVSFTSSIKAKCMHNSNDKVHNRKLIFYLTRTKHDCTYPKLSVTVTQQLLVTNRRPCAISRANIGGNFGINTALLSGFIVKLLRCKHSQISTDYICSERMFM